MPSSSRPEPVSTTSAPRRSGERRRRRIRGLALLLLLALAAACERRPEAVILHQKTIVAGGEGEPRVDESMQYWTDRMLVLVQPAGHFIVDFQAEATTSVNQRNRTVVRRTFAENQAKMDVENAQRQQQAADYPEDARAELERMGQIPGPNLTKVELRPTGRSETIAGYQAREIEFTGSAAKGALWISDALPLPLGEKEIQAYRRSTAGMNAASMQFALAMAEAGGIPLRTVLTASLNPHGQTVTNEVIDVRRGPLPAELSGAPDDFARLTPGATP